MRDLKIVRTLAAQRNFARASEELGMSQPALSRALVRIEQMMGVELFERSRTAVTPTPYAEIVLDRCDVLIAGFEDIAQAVSTRRKSTDEGFRISVGPFAAEATGLAAFADYAAGTRGAVGQLMVRDWRNCLLDVLERRSDLAVTDTRSAAEYEGLATENLGGAEVNFFCSRRHVLAGRNDIGWDDLVRHPWALTLMQGRWLDYLPSNLRAAGRVDRLTGDFVPAICVDTFSAMTAAVRNGRAISAAPPAFIRDELQRGDFVVLPFHEPWMRMEYGLVWRDGQSWSRGLSEFVGKLRGAHVADDLSG